MRMDGLEQMTLTVADISASVRFYTLTLGLLAATFGPEGTILHAGSQKLLLRQGDPPSDLGRIAFVTRAGMPILTGHLAVRGVPVVTGPQRRADGRESLVIRDPDGHEIEVISAVT